jgi:hypothetical protein
MEKKENVVMTCLLRGGGRRHNRVAISSLTRQFTAVFAFFLITFLFALPAAIAATVDGRSEPTQGPQFSYAGAAIYRFPAKVGGGGDLSVFSLYFSADVSTRVNEKLGVGLGLVYEYDDYNFTGLEGFFVPRPWSGVQRLGFSIPIFYDFNDKWKLVVVPSGQFSGEFGARFEDALVYGGAVAVSHTFGPKLSLGLGVAGYYNLAQVRVFPFPLIRFKFSDRLRVSNPFRTGPAGPAGLEVTYKLRDQWEIGLGGAYRSYRFRLDYNGPLPNGIGQYTSIPVFVRLSYRPSPALGLDVYGGPLS